MPEEKQQKYEYLIIGGGVAAGYAAEGIREEDQAGTIGIISADQDAPYTRPALSKKLWTDEEFTEDQVPFQIAEKTGAEIFLNTSVVSIDREKHSVRLEDNSSVGYHKLLLVTGAEPASIDGPEDERVISFRTFEDYRRLRKWSGNNQHIIVVGGSYIGTELAAALIQNNTQVTLVYPEKILNEKTLPEELAKEYENSYREAGVELIPDTRADSYSKEDDKIIVQLDNGTAVKGDVLVLGLGVSPRLSLAEEAGLEVEGGVIVDEYLQTSDPDIYAAGDIAAYLDPIFGRKRMEHVDHARKSGTAAGKNMAGAHEPYDYTPYFYSVVFSISWKAIGKMDSSLDMLIDEMDGGKVVYYLEENRPVGILAWNFEPDLDEMRELLENPPSDPNELKGKILSKEE